MRRAFLAAGLAVLTAAGSAVVRVTPTQFDFGKTATPGGAALHQFQVSGAPSDVVTFSIQGSQANEFAIVGRAVRGSSSTTTCLNASGNPTSSCPVNVDFRPTSNGVKTALLVVTNQSGGRATAALRGEGVTAGCEMKVVFCNYAHLYSGRFAWSNTLNAPNSHFDEHVQVDVINGVATCNGGIKQVDGGQTTTGSINGTGLIAVEFEKDSANSLVYKITVACPTVAGMGSPSQPAELGHNDQTTYQQPATAIAQPDLTGSSSIPAPETDAVNGVTGTLSVSWSLKRS